MISLLSDGRRVGSEVSSLSVTLESEADGLRRDLSLEEGAPKKIEEEPSSRQRGCLLFDFLE